MLTNHSLSVNTHMQNNKLSICVSRNKELEDLVEEGCGQNLVYFWCIVEVCAGIRYDCLCSEGGYCLPMVPHDNLEIKFCSDF